MELIHLWVKKISSIVQNVRAENVLLKHMMLNYRNHLISHLVSQLLQVISIVHISQIQQKHTILQLLQESIQNS